VIQSSEKYRTVFIVQSNSKLDVRWYTKLCVSTAFSYFITNNRYCNSVPLYTYMQNKLNISHWEENQDNETLRKTNFISSKLQDCRACNWTRCCCRNACYRINVRSLRLPTAV
jgi:hypothetical protein